MRTYATYTYTGGVHLSASEWSQYLLSNLWSSYGITLKRSPVFHEP